MHLCSCSSLAYLTLYLNRPLFFFFILTDASLVSSSFRLSLVWNLVRYYVLFIVDVLEANSRTGTC